MWYYEGGIRIEPDWNVKLQKTVHGLYHQN